MFATLPSLFDLRSECAAKVEIDRQTANRCDRASRAEPRHPVSAVGGIAGAPRPGALAQTNPGSGIGGTKPGSRLFSARLGMRRYRPKESA